MDEKCYSLKDTAVLLGIKVRTMRQWIRDGKIKAFRYEGNRRWYVTESEVRRLKNGNEN